MNHRCLKEGKDLLRDSSRCLNPGGRLTLHGNPTQAHITADHVWAYFHPLVFVSQLRLKLNWPCLRKRRKQTWCPPMARPARSRTADPTGPRDTAPMRTPPHRWGPTTSPMTMWRPPCVMWKTWRTDSKSWTIPTYRCPISFSVEAQNPNWHTTYSAMFSSKFQEKFLNLYLAYHQKHDFQWKPMRGTLK